MSKSPPNPTASRYPGVPRWVKVVGIVAAVVVVLIVAMLLVGGGEHGPGRHLGSDNPTIPSDAGAPEHQPPVGGHSP